MAEAPGGRERGRNLEVGPVELGDLGEASDLFWPAGFPAVLTNEEVMSARLMIGGAPPADLIAQRMAAGQVAMGQGLVAGLLHGCRDAGVRLLRGCQAESLIVEASGRVNGIRAAGHDMPARLGVVLACGGFDQEPRLRRQLLDGPYHHPVAPPVGRGAALRLAGGAGAALSHTGESWSWPVRPASGAPWPDGTPRFDLVVAERVLPHSLWVDTHGRRFVDESAHNCALAFAHVDPATGRPRHLPAWAIVDSQYRRRYPLAGVMPTQPTPEEVAEADDLNSLAAHIGVDGGTLEETVRRFNTYAEAGCDPDFARGYTAYDRYWGDPAAPHPNLGPLSQSPYFAVPILPGLVGTKGGLDIDADANVLDWNGETIPGLYAAGNAAAATIGPGTVSAGSTVGSAIAWGFTAGTAAARKG
ncbi:MAG: FAD-binding protein [Stackebrandtia sp.]